MLRRDILGLALGALAAVPAGAQAMSLVRPGSVAGAVRVQDQQRREERREEKKEEQREERREERREDRCERLKLQSRQIHEHLEGARGEQRERLLGQLHEIREKEKQAQCGR
jgi:hypothetical protein